MSGAGSKIRYLGTEATKIMSQNTPGNIQSEFFRAQLVAKSTKVDSVGNDALALLTNIPGGRISLRKRVGALGNGGWTKFVWK